jgi:hypothetical protein
MADSSQVRTKGHKTWSQPSLKVNGITWDRVRAGESGLTAVRPWVGQAMS